MQGVYVPLQIPLLHPQSVLVGFPPVGRISLQKDSWQKKISMNEKIDTQLLTNCRIAFQKLESIQQPTLLPILPIMLITGCPKKGTNRKKS